MPTSVKLYNSSMAGSPGQINNVVGCAIPILDACLVNGWGTQTPTSIMVDGGGNAVVTLSGANPFELHTVILVTGSDQTELNGEHKIVSRSASTCTFKCNLSNITATGTITVKLPGAGWTKVFTGTNKAVYRPAASGTEARPFYLVDDSLGVTFILSGYENMTDVGTGTGKFESVSKWQSKGADASLRDWCIIADSKSLYYGVAYSQSLAIAMAWSFWGNYVSNNVNDQYNAFISGDMTGNLGSSFTIAPGHVPRSDWTQGTSVLMRSYTGQPGFAPAWKGIRYVNLAMGFYNSTSFMPCPNPSDNKLHLTPFWVYETNSGTERGKMPGLLVPTQYTENRLCAGRRWGTFIDNVDGFPNKTFQILPQNVNGTVYIPFMIDVTGPWNY